MTRFFAGGLSDSDLSSSDEEDLYGTSSSESQLSSSESESESEESEDEASQESEDDKPKTYTRNKFLKGSGAASSSDEDSSDDDRKVVKSNKEKLLDEIEQGAKTLDSERKNGDWLEAQAAFDKMVKAAEKANRQYKTVPLAFVKVLSELNSALIAETKAKKKLSPSQSKAQNVLRQRLRKVERDFIKSVDAYAEDPENYRAEAPLVSELAGKRDVSAAAGQSAPGDNVFKTLISIVELRGKKNTDRAEQVTVLEGLLEQSVTAYQKISVLLMLIPIRFDLTSTGSIMPLATWKAIDKDIRSLFEVIEAHSDEYMVIESAPEPEDLEAGPVADEQGIKKIPGSISALIERLDDEHTRALQVIDPHTTEYIERLRDETKLYDLILRAQAHNERNLARLGQSVESSEALCRLLIRRVDHIYYKPTSAVVTTEIEAWSRVPASLSSEITPRAADVAAGNEKQYTIDTVNALCQVLYRQPNTVFRTRAMLAVIYRYALSDEYYQARDLLLMSHLQSTISSNEQLVQVLFNRALVQVGLCAFRVGLIHEALQSLQEICSGNRLKELLGQGVAKFQTATPTDRQQLLPYHMHINLELLESVHLTCSMLVEVPYLASQGANADIKKKSLSKPFRRLLDYYSRQVFSGPPDTTREHIIHAARAQQVGDWKLASQLLSSIKVWNLCPEPAKIGAMLRSKLQVESLRTFFLTFGPSYESLALDYLVQMFELPLAQVKALTIKMIANDEIQATLDADEEFVLFRTQAQLTKLQVLSQALSEKTMQLVERNERLAGDGHQPDQKKQQRPVRRHHVSA